MTIATEPIATPAVKSPAVKTDADILRHAALLIEERGLHKGAFINHSTGALCLFGALNLATCGDATGKKPGGPEDRQMQDACARLPGFIRRNVVAWNDAYDRTAAEVIALLRAAADAA